VGKAVGVEINESRIKVIAVESTAKRTRILGYHEESIPSDPAHPWDIQAVESLKKAFAVSKISKGKVVASIDSGEAILRDVTLPFKEEEKIRKTIHGELESLIHNHTIEELVVDYFKTGETEKGTV
jgi:Tfp pilus assembly PilM family ATPase